jgi:hypothetical protein
MLTIRRCSEGDFRNTWKYMCLLLCAILLTSGCAYPDELRKQNQGNPREYILLVQQAVDLYREKNGYPPIKNSDMNTPKYEKYRIDFGKLQKVNYLSTIPANAYESGGTYIYVLVNVETEPEVKMMDLQALQTVNDLQDQVDSYFQANKQYPNGISISDEFSYLDFKALGIPVPTVTSVYNPQQFLMYIIEKSTGMVAIDYAPDLSQFIEKQALASSLAADEDLRERLVSSSVFIPVSSYTYRWLNNQPVPINVR